MYVCDMQKYESCGSNLFEFNVYKSADVIKVDPKTKSVELKFCKYYREDVEKKTVVLNFNMDIVAQYNPRECDSKRECLYCVYYPRNCSNCKKDTDDCVKLKLQTSYGCFNMSECFENLRDFRELIPYKHLKEEYRCYMYSDYTLHVFDGGRIYVVSNFNGDIEDAMIESDYSLQQGDNGTTVWLINGNHFLVWNDGDVSSTVVIKCHGGTKKRTFKREYEPVKDMSEPFNGKSAYNFV